MINSPAHVVAQYLRDAGVGTQPTAGEEWPVYVNNLPVSPDNCLVVYDTNAPKTVYQHGNYEGDHGVQVSVRAVNHQAGWVQARRVLQSLVSAYRVGVSVPAPPTAEGTGTVHYLLHCASNVGSILRLGKEAPTSKRDMFSINLTVTLHQCPTGV